MTTLELSRSQQRRPQFCKFVKGQRKIKVEWPDVATPDWYSKTEYERRKNEFTGAQVSINVNGVFIPLT